MDDPCTTSHVLNTPWEEFVVGLYEHTRSNLADMSPLPMPLLANTPLAATQRAIGEFVAGRPVLLADGEGAARLVLPVEGLTPERLAALAACADEPIDLFVSGTRAAALGARSIGAGVVRLAPSSRCEQVLALAGAVDLQVIVDAGDRVAAAAIELAKLARLLPAALAVRWHAGGSAAPTGAVSGVTASEVLAFRAGLASSLRLVSSARVPLHDAGDSSFEVFRDALGQFWTAVVIGDVDRTRPVPVRLHSACLTGDALGSRRCDCGDQLRMAIAMIAARGGGVLLYLDQEGCGIGLANKMRAYALQDRGVDTIDANTTLGFERDERRYDIAARMLRLLGIGEVALLTNNPTKMAGLREAGVLIAERIALVAPVNESNRDYLRAKQQRAGHLIGSAQPDSEVPDA
ncbi:GTP cyclohydrolase II RibA [Vineibacter terrae]|uniref:GTP cyclohydrolase-2 n=1 Tax=Vineibacter terrae TaxID=2586908 RepID=A0A5C8P980_9HYPH|nr:GTP cyclohydrolase II RibA [Vineibacter terrae]TXL70078.1 GTP cyclohydrolase II RibA [Vineibacter terrae]